MTATPTDIVRDFYRKLAAGDVPGVLSLMASDIEWITMWHYHVEGRGPGAVAEGLFKPLAAEWKSSSLVPTAFIAEGETVVSLGDFKGIHGATGKTAEARYAHVWTVTEGKISRFRQYIDTLAVADARSPYPAGARRTGESEKYTTHVRSIPDRRPGSRPHVLHDRRRARAGGRNNAGPREACRTGRPCRRDRAPP